MFRESPTYDKGLYWAEDHQVLSDRLQIVIRHPTTCAGRGARKDRYKTFHRWPLAMRKLEACGIAITPEQQAQLTEVGKACDVARR